LTAVGRRRLRRHEGELGDEVSNRVGDFDALHVDHHIGRARRGTGARRRPVTARRRSQEGALDHCGSLGQSALAREFCRGEDLRVQVGIASHGRSFARSSTLRAWKASGHDELPGRQPSAGHESNMGAARGSRNGHGGIAAARRAPLGAAAVVFDAVGFPSGGGASLTAKRMKTAMRVIQGFSATILPSFMTYTGVPCRRATLRASLAARRSERPTALENALGLMARDFAVMGPAPTRSVYRGSYRTRSDARFLACGSE
jgi:hypothetical protein